MQKTKVLVAQKTIAQKYWYVAFFFLALLLFLPHAFAAETVQTDIGTVYDWPEYVSTVWGWIAPIVIGIAVLAIVVGGLLLVGSGGNENRADIGRQTVRGGVIGIIITIFSAAFNIFIQNPVANQNDTSLASAQSSIDSAITGVLSIVGVASAIGIVYAGIKYMTANGEEEKLQSAKNALKFSVIGLGISLGAWIIAGFLMNNLGASAN